MERGAGWRGIEWRRGQTANTLRGVNGLNLVTEGGGGGKRGPQSPIWRGKTGGRKRVLAEMGVQEGRGLRGSHGNSEREGQGKTRRLEEAPGGGGQ